MVKKKMGRPRTRKYTRKKLSDGTYKFVPYVSRRHPDDPIKIHFVEKADMTKGGLMKFPSRTRPYIITKVYKHVLRVDVQPGQINTVEKIKEFAIDMITYPGKYIMRGFSVGRTKTGIKPVRLAVIDLMDSPNGMKAHISEYWRMKRYWFWRGD